MRRPFGLALLIAFAGVALLALPPPSVTGADDVAIPRCAPGHCQPAPPPPPAPDPAPQRLAPASTADGLVMRARFGGALRGTPWPAYLQDTVWAIAVCESGHFDTDRDAWVINPRAVGDEGLAIGAMQIRTDVWPGLVSAFDLQDLRENLVAAYVVYLEFGRTFQAWSCAPLVGAQ